MKLPTILAFSFSTLALSTALAGCGPAPPRPVPPSNLEQTGLTEAALIGSWVPAQAQTTDDRITSVYRFAADHTLTFQHDGVTEMDCPSGCIEMPFHATNTGTWSLDHDRLTITISRGVNPSEILTRTIEQADRDGTHLTVKADGAKPEVATEIWTRQ